MGTLEIILTAAAGLFGGLNILQFFFWRSTKKEYEARAEKAKQEAAGVATENESKAVATLKEAISELIKMNKEYADDKLTLNQKVDELNEKMAAKDDAIATLLTMICKHMACTLREPIPGQGRKWFEDNQSDISLGIDYLPINQLMVRYGEKKKREKEKEDNG